MWLKALGKQGLSYIKKVPISPYRYFWRPTITEMPGAQVTKKYKNANRPRKVHPWDQPRIGR